MNRYILIRRLRWPAILMLIGVVALLHQMGAIDHFWHLFVPLLLILLGVLMLAERAVLAADGGYPPYLGQYPGAPYPGAIDPATGQAIPPQPPAQTGTSIVPAHSHTFESDPIDDRDGGQS
jgi:hypothetical protein